MHRGGAFPKTLQRFEIDPTLLLRGVPSTMCPFCQLKVQRFAGLLRNSGKIT
jgi:hypothetical protein